MRVRHASSSIGESGMNCANDASPPKRPLNGPPAKMQRRVERERAEQAVDVVGDAERGAARVRVDGRDQPIGGGRDHRVFVLRQEDRH